VTQGTVAYLGPQGTFSEEAAILFAPESERLPYPSIRDAAMAAESRDTDEAILPIENSIEGAVNMTLDYLIHESTLSIVGEVVLAVRQCLVAAEDTRREDIETIRSHPQALAQCRRYLNRNFPKAKLVASISTAGAVEEALNVEGAGWAQQIPDAGFDAVLDVAGVPGMEDQLIGAARQSGLVLFIAGRDKVSYTFNLGQNRVITIKQNSHFYTDDLDNLCRLVSRGMINLTPLLQDVAAAEDARRIYDTLRDQPNELLGTVFSWTA
jgi:prephenate dehydratase